MEPAPPALAGGSFICIFSFCWENVERTPQAEEKAWGKGCKLCKSASLREAGWVGMTSGRRKAPREFGLYSDGAGELNILCAITWSISRRVTGIMQEGMCNSVDKEHEHHNSKSRIWGQNAKVNCLLLGCGCSVIKLYLTLCDRVDCTTPDFPILHYLQEFAQIHVHWANDAIQPSHPLSPPSP